MDLDEEDDENSAFATCSDPLNTQVATTEEEPWARLDASAYRDRALEETTSTDDASSVSASPDDVAEGAVEEGRNAPGDGDGTTSFPYDDDDSNADKHVTVWLKEATDDVSESEKQHFENQVQGLVKEAFDNEETQSLEYFHKEATSSDSRNALLDQDIQTWLVDTFVTLPGQESGLDDNEWSISETDLKITNFRSWFDDTIREDVPHLEGGAGVEGGETDVRFVSKDGWRGLPTVDVTLASSSPRSGPASGFDDHVVTVKFLLDAGEVFTRAYRPHVSTGEIKEDLATTFHIPAEVVWLTVDGNPMQDHTSLAQLGIKPFGIVEIKCISTDPQEYPISTSNIYEYIKVPDVINVTVQLSPEVIKEVVVEIDNQCIKKPWVGGYFNKKTGFEFHHAFSQTHPRNACMRGEGKSHRDTQTTRWSSKYQNTVSEKATQMERHGRHIPCVHDKVVTAKKYVTHEETEARRDVLQKVSTIQRYARGWLARRKLRNSEKELERLLSWEREADRRRREERRRKVETNAARKDYPRTRADFDVLYNMMERWHRAEMENIVVKGSEGPKKSEMFRLLEKEVVIISSIEKHRIRLREEKLAQKELDFLKKSSQPIKWTGYKGCKISMDTIRTQRARELKQMYHCLCNDSICIEERVNILLSLKHALKSYDCCDKVVEIVDLMDRECDCLIRGLKRSQLDVLRKRLRQMFLEFIKDPLFNDDTRKHSTVFSTDDNTQLCIRCRKLLPLSVFKLNTGSKTVKHCKSCWWIENIARPRTDLWPYRYMLQVVRKEEQKRSCHSSVAFVMQDEDFYHLVVNIWQSRSAISESTELDELCLSRWDVNKDWAPWNCILLTHKEARAHSLSKRSLEEIYEPDFAANVAVKHQEARVYFQRLAKVDENFRDWRPV